MGKLLDLTLEHLGTVHDGCQSSQSVARGHQNRVEVVVFIIPHIDSEVVNHRCVLQTPREKVINAVNSALVDNSQMAIVFEAHKFS